MHCGIKKNNLPQPHSGSMYTLSFSSNSDKVRKVMVHERSPLQVTHGGQGSPQRPEQTWLLYALVTILAHDRHHLRARQSTFTRLVTRRSITDFIAFLGALVMLAGIGTLTDAANTVLVALATALVSMGTHVVTLFSTTLSMVVWISAALGTSMATNQLFGAAGRTFTAIMRMRFTTLRRRSHKNEYTI